LPAQPRIRCAHGAEPFALAATSNGAGVALSAAIQSTQQAGSLTERPGTRPGQRIGTIRQRHDPLLDTVRASLAGQIRPSITPGPPSDEEPAVTATAQRTYRSTPNPLHATLLAGTVPLFLGAMLR